MKFGKKLQHQLDNTLPEWRPNYLCYKQLKKLLKQLGKVALMTFLTTAILDENQDEGFLIPVPGDDFSGGEDRDDVAPATKRKPTSAATGDGFVFEEPSKKRVKLPEPPTTTDDFPETTSPRRLTEKDENFLRLVKTELHKFNAFFLEKEEEFLIRLSILEERTAEVKEKHGRASASSRAGGNGDGDGVSFPATYEEMFEVHRQIVTLHGEMVLLMNYSSLNYVGLLKILKKYDKHTKSNLRQLVHGSVLRQPFFGLANLKKMVARSLASVRSLQSVFPTPEIAVEPPSLGHGLPREVAAAGDVSAPSEAIPRQIRAALQTMQEIQ